MSGRPRHGWRLGAVIGIVGVIASSIAALGLHRIQQASARDELRLLANDAADVIGQRIRGPIDLLSALDALFEADDDVTRAEFHAFVVDGGLLDLHPGVQAIEFARRLAPEEVAGFERTVRQDRSLRTAGYPGFRVTGRGDGADLFVVDYVEPLAGNEPAHGLDLGGEATRRLAAERARDRGEVVVTAPIALRQGPAEQAGFLALRPVYSGEREPRTVPERRRSLYGHVLVVARAGDLLATALGDEPPADVEIYDVGETTSFGPIRLRDNDLILDTDTGVAALSDARSTLREVIDLDVGGRRWRLVVTPGVRFDAGSPLPIAILVAGLLASALLVHVVVGKSRHAARAEALVVERTAELRAANTRLTENDRLKTSFISTVSHELRTPLSAVTGFTRILANRYDSFDDTQRTGMIEIAHRNASQLLALIEDILDFGRFERGAVELTLVEHDLGALVDDLRLGLEGLTRGHRLVVERDHPVPALVDRVKITRILNNLVNNAAKFAPPDTTIRVCVRAMDDEAVIEVVDEGPGIAPDDLPHLFDRFYRGETADPYPGTGIGLSVVRELSHLMGGRTWAGNDERGGARFGVALPLLRAPVPGREHPGAVTARSGAGERRGAGPGA